MAKIATGRKSLSIASMLNLFGSLATYSDLQRDGGYRFRTVFPNSPCAGMTSWLLDAAKNAGYYTIESLSRDCEHCDNAHRFNIYDRNAMP